MRFGVFMAPYHPLGDSPLITYRRDLELIEWCDRLGYDEAWVGEHHSAAWENIPDPAVFLAAAGERTRRIRLGSGVVSLPYHHPMMVADQFVQLDYLTGGRAMLGVGPGALISDALMMGIDPVTQRGRMDESLGAIVRLLAGEVVTHESEWFTLRDARLQMLPVNGSLPIAVASTTSPSGMTCAGTHGVGVLSLGAGLIGDQKDLGAQWELGQKAAANAGKELRREDWRLVLRAHIAPTREEAIDAVRAGREYEREHYYRRVAGMKNEVTLEEEIERDASIVGTPDDMIAAIGRLQDATGGFGGFMVLANDWATPEAQLRSYELIARRVMPEVRGQIAPLRASYDMVAANKRDYGAPAMAAIRKAYEDAGEPLPDGLVPGKLR